MGLTDAISAVVHSELSHVHTTLPARIISYEYRKQRAKIQPLINRNYRDGTILSLPPLSNVPVHFQRSGGASLTFPVNKGDTGFFICCERSIDQWLSKGGMATPQDGRMFDLSDAIFIPGIFPFSENSPAENNDDVVLKYSGSSITIKKSGSIEIDAGVGRVSIKNAADELLSIVDALITSFTTSTVIVPPTPIPPAIGILSNIVELGVLKTRLATLK